MLPDRLRLWTEKFRVSTRELLCFVPTGVQQCTCCTSRDHRDQPESLQCSKPCLHCRIAVQPQWRHSGHPRFRHTLPSDSPSSARCGFPLSRCPEVLSTLRTKNRSRSTSHVDATLYKIIFRMSVLVPATATLRPSRIGEMQLKSIAGMPSAHCLHRYREVLCGSAGNRRPPNTFICSSQQHSRPIQERKARDKSHFE